MRKKEHFRHGTDAKEGRLWIDRSAGLRIGEPISPTPQNLPVFHDGDHGRPSGLWGDSKMLIGERLSRFGRQLLDILPAKRVRHRARDDHQHCGPYRETPEDRRLPWLMVNVCHAVTL